jgi:hypothetical protein
MVELELTRVTLHILYSSGVEVPAGCTIADSHQIIIETGCRLVLPIRD